MVILIEILTNNHSNASRQDIHDAMNYDLATSKISQERAIFI